MERLKNIISIYGWLILALIFSYFAGGDRPIEIAVWLSPLLLLRFFREVKLWKGIVFSLPLIIAVTFIADYGMTPIPFNIAIILTAINSAIALLAYVVDSLLSNKLPNSLKTLLFPMTAVALEAFAASEFSGGTWGNPAYGINNLSLLQFASIAGIWGVMFLIYWTASVVNEVWENRHHLTNVRKSITVFLVILGIIYGFGLLRLHQDNTEDKMIRVAGVTPGPEHQAEMMEIFGKIFSSARTGVFDKEGIKTGIEIKFQGLLSESVKAAKSGAEVIAWPEGATFIFKSDEEVFVQQATNAARDNNFYLGMGVAVLDDSLQSLLANNKPFVENKIIFISPSGNIDWEYLKYNLAPGYEHAMTIRGDGILKLSDTQKGSVTGAICYDMDFPQYISQSGANRSDLIIAPSNDWPEIKNTHAQMARLRAIENGSSLLRPTSSGISIAVDQYGNIVSNVDDFKSNGAPLVSVLPMRSVQTVYASIGDILIWICAFGGIVLIILGVVKKRKQIS